MENGEISGNIGLGVVDPMAERGRPGVTGHWRATEAEKEPTHMR
jgi:hypothetical protein